MKSLGWMRKELLVWIEDYEDVSGQNTAINRAISIVTSNKFQQLYKTKDITPSSSGNFYLPPRCDDVLEIHPQTDGAVSDGRFRGARRMPGPLRRDIPYSRCIGSRETSSLEGVEIDFVTGSNVGTVSGGTLPETYIGAEMMIVDGVEKYEIISIVGDSVTFYPEFRWTSTTSEVIINPAGTPLYKIFNSDGTPYTEEVTVEYYKLHPYLVRDRDMLLVSAPNSVVLEAVKILLRSAKYDVDAQRLESDLLYYKGLEYPKNQSKEEFNQSPNDTLFRVRNRGH